MRLSYLAHHGQVDKGGCPYVFHPFHLAEQMDSEEAVAALLHDVVEDTDYTLEELRSQGFPGRGLKALALLTHDKEVPYLEYVRQIEADPLARQVKLADLLHNSDPTRLDEADPKRLEKYRQAIELLEAEDPSAPF